MSDTNQHIGEPARRAAAAAALRAAEREAKDKCMNAERKPEAGPKAKPDWEARMNEACTCHGRTMPWTYYALIGAWTYYALVLGHSTSMA